MAADDLQKVSEKEFTDLRSRCQVHTVQLLVHYKSSPFKHNSYLVSTLLLFV